MQSALLTLADPGVETGDAVATARAPARDSRPNILFIRTDDQRAADMDARRPDGELVMKNVRTSIAGAGVSFTNFHVTLPLCCPSRATTLTGQYAHNHGVLTNGSPDGGYDRLDHANTLPIWLQSAGYHTIHVGKYMNDYGVDLTSTAPIPPGWDDWFTLMLAYGHSYYDYKVRTAAGVLHFSSADPVYQTDLLTRQVRSFLMTRPYGDRPFFIQLDYMAPHASNPDPEPPDRYAGVMDGVPLPFAPAFNELDVSDKPEAIRDLPLLGPAQVEKQARFYRTRSETLLAVDEGIGAIVATLQQTGQLADTLIVFTSDNGFLLGEHRLDTTKKHPYDESTRVPLYIRGPGVPAGVVTEQLVGNVDLVPTFLAWSGAQAGRTQDGRSLVPLIADPALPWRRTLLLENPLQLWYTGLRVRQRDGSEYLFVEYDYDPDGSGPAVPDGIADERELYALTPDACDVDGDAHQMESSHADPCQTGRLHRFSARLSRLRNCRGIRCR